MIEPKETMSMTQYCIKHFRISVDKSLTERFANEIDMVSIFSNKRRRDCFPGHENVKIVFLPDTDPLHGYW